MLPQGPIRQEIAGMRRTAEFLMPHSFPLKTAQDEEDITVLKQRHLVIDGYEVVAYHSHCLYPGDIRLETLQIYGKFVTFLPFRVVCKLAKLVLGDRELGLVEMMHHREQGKVDEFARKIYVWKVYYSPEGSPIPNPFVAGRKSCVFEGFHYDVVPQNQIAFF